MFKERFQEILEFTKSESPYRKVNKGWINQDIFLDLNPSSDAVLPKNEAAKVTVFWSPINTLLSNIFIIIIISSILVFTSLSFAKGRFNFNLFNTYFVNDIVKVEDNNLLKINQIKDLDSMNSINQQNLEIKQLDQKNNKISSDEIQINLDQKTATKDIDKEDSSIKDKENNRDIKISEKKKSKSNFI